MSLPKQTLHHEKDIQYLLGAGLTQKASFVEMFICNSRSCGNVSSRLTKPHKGYEVQVEKIP